MAHSQEGKYFNKVSHYSVTLNSSGHSTEKQYSAQALSLPKNKAIS